MWAMLLVGVLFAAGAVYNIVGPEPNPTEAVAGGLIAIILVGLFFATRYHRKQAADFAAWLAHNVQASQRGGALYQGSLVTPATVLARYQVAVSFLIVTFRFPTRPYIVGYHTTGGVAAVCTILSLALGWWGIPWGPIYTVQVVTRNLRGGFKQTVGDLLASQPGLVPAGVKSSPGAA